MTAPKHAPTTVRELTRHIQREHPHLDTSYKSDSDQLLVVGQPGKPESPAALREILGSGHFDVQDEQVTGRSRWVAIVNPADGEGG